MNRNTAFMMAAMAAMAGQGISGGSINSKMELAGSAGSGKHSKGRMAKGTQPKRYEQKQIGACKFFRKFGKVKRPSKVIYSNGGV